MDHTNPLSQAEALALARHLFRLRYAQCFWHMPKDFVITLETLPTIIDGLKRYGNREDYVAARRLCR